MSVQGQRQEAKEYRETLNALMKAGADEGRAAQIARIEDPLERNMEAVKEVGFNLSTMDRQQAKGLVETLSDSYPLMAQMSTFGHYYESGRLPQLEEVEADAKGQKQYRVTENGREGEATVMSEEAARKYVQSRMEDMVEEEHARLADKFLADAMVTAAAERTDQFVVEEVVREGAKRVHDAREVEVASDPAAMEDAAFSNGACIEVTDERGLVCKSGVVRIDMLKLLPQFKLGADKETGEVSALGGEYFADHDPIRIFRNEKGELVVFSGRHRLAAAKRAGAERIVAYVYDGKTEEWARRYDIELNIRDNQATALEVAMYVRGEFTGGEALTPEQVSSVGIAREGKLGAIGLRIGRNAGESVMDALRNGKIEDSEALAIADFAPGNENVQRKGLAILLEGGSKTEARERMVAELELAKMAKELGIEQGEDLFGNTMDNDAWLDYVAKYVVRRRNEISKDIQYLRTTATRKNAKAMAEKYGVDVTDPDGMKKALREAEALRERWKSPYTDSELMNEVREAYRAEHPGEEAASQSEQVWADYSRQVDEMREGVTHFSTSGEKEEKYRVVSDTVGLQEHLNDRVEPVEINYEPGGKNPDWRSRAIEYFRDYLKDREIYLKNAGYTLHTGSKNNASNAAANVTSQRSYEIFKGAERAIENAYRLATRNPIHKGKNKKREDRMKRANSMEFFAYPVRVNGENYLLWFNATTKKKGVNDANEPDQKHVLLYEVGFQPIKNEALSELTGLKPDAHESTPDASILADYLRNVKTKSEWMPEIVEKNSKEHDSLELAEAKKQGMFKDGKMVAGNAVITEPGVTHFSVDDAQHASPHEFDEFDLKHVGRGEGAQAYGYGLYFSGNWGVNRSYHEHFTKEINVYKSKARFLSTI